MKEVKAYQCEFCKKIFATPYKHGVCKNDPSAIHCGGCKFYKHTSGRYPLEEYDHADTKNFCQKHLMANGIPRRKECSGYEEDLIRFTQSF